MISINLLPDSERQHRKEAPIDLPGMKREIDWFSLAPKIAGGLLALMVIVTIAAVYIPNIGRAKLSSRLQKEWKELEPNYKAYQKKEEEEKKYKDVVDEFYRFLDERVIWSRQFFVLAKNALPEIRLVKLTAKDENKKYDVVERVMVEEKIKGKNKEAVKKEVEKVVTKFKLVHTIELSGLVPIDGQAKVISFKKNLEKDDFLKTVLQEIKIPGITATSSTFKSFSMSITFDTVKADRE